MIAVQNLFGSSSVWCGGEAELEMDWTGSIGPWTGQEGGTMNTRTELPDLPASSSPLQFGGWLHVSTPSMKDISGVAGWWWEAHPDLPKTPRQPLRTQVPTDRTTRCADVAEQQELVTDRALSSTASLYKVMVRFQPGGAGEKQILLQQLTTPWTSRQPLDCRRAGCSCSWTRSRSTRACGPSANVCLRGRKPCV